RVSRRAPEGESHAKDPHLPQDDRGYQRSTCDEAERQRTGELQKAANGAEGELRRREEQQRAEEELRRRQQQEQQRLAEEERRRQLEEERRNQQQEQQRLA